MGGIDEPVAHSRAATRGGEWVDVPMRPVEAVIDEALTEEQRRERQAEDERRQQDARDMLHAALARCPGDHYRTVKVEAAEGRFDDVLNNHFFSGYRLAHVIDRDGETYLVFEHHFH
ncbi:MAG: hypothetical protein JWM93_3433 [Frankiales bacterium]|nr:hypothetical protein [Frankiales bacterium]